MDLDQSVARVGALLKPRNVVVVGASDRTGSWPATVWQTVNRYGYAGPVYAVNPNREQIFGARCYADVTSLPEPPDHLVILVKSELVPDVLRAGAEAGARSATIYSSGFSETGTAEGHALAARLEAVVAETGIAISGPNCTGNICAENHLVTMVDHRVLTIGPGPVALLGQSGGVMLYANHILADRGIQIGYLISSGNELGLTTADYIAFLAREPSVKVIYCYLESIRDPERFKEACAAAQTAGKPVVAFKLGASQAGRESAMTHTGTLAGSAEVFDAVAGAYGVIRVESLDEAIEIIELVVHAGVPIGRRVGALSLSGAYRGILLDGAAGSELVFPPLAPNTTERLAAVLSTGSYVGNPADGGFSVLTSVENYIESIEAVAEESAVDIVLLQAELPREPGMAAHWEERFERIDDVAMRCGKPVVVVSMYSRDFTDYTRKLRAGLSHVAFMQETRKSVSALSHLIRWSEIAAEARERSRAEALPGTVPAPLPAPLIEAVTRARDAANRASPGSTTALNEPESKALLRACGIATGEEAWVSDVEEAVAAAERIGYPVVLKAVSAELTHKSDFSAVKLAIADAPALRKACAEIQHNLADAGFAGPDEGLLVSAEHRGGVELVLGVHRDPEMGPVVMAGSGGVLLELVRDVGFAALPVTLEAARDLLRRTRAARRLEGYRGNVAHSVDGAAQALVGLGQLAAVLGEILESIDINPFVSGPAGDLALDALVVLRHPSD